jgi:hypothetical protein
LAYKSYGQQETKHIDLDLIITLNSGGNEPRIISYHNSYLIKRE